LRSDWLNGKSHDNFAPMGPFLVPRAFVPDHKNLFIRLAVNGEVRQSGNTSQFIFTPEEQIEYASNILTLEPGDIFSCGTCGGVGQGTNTFLKVGDVMETEIGFLGKMRNRFVGEGLALLWRIYSAAIDGVSTLEHRTQPCSSAHF
jgi:2-keto-4-pentenoate hydratase/2-oxohepta-3-ene-1,7-dioic acid hydratase in catechol pathway